MQIVRGDRLPWAERCFFLLFCLICLLPIAEIRGAEDQKYPKYGPRNKPVAIPLSQSNEYLRSGRNDAPDFWRLMPYYVPQITGGSCSVASVAMIVNGFIRSGRQLNDKDTVVTQSDLLDGVKRHPWKKRRGLSLEKLHIVLRESLEMYGVSAGDTRRVQTSRNTPEDFDEFRRVLELNERSADDFILVHYLQGLVTRAPGGSYPHISPIGAYDIEKRKVLILDVDRKWYEPYWVSDKILFKAMLGKTRAFGHGGYIHIRLPSK